MVRKEWINLNGLWDYAILAKDSTAVNFQGKILVPFPVESALSGVMKKVGKENRVWYKREIEISAKWKNSRTLLHFEAVDWQTNVLIDGKDIGWHKGGYDPFTFDITNFVLDGKKHDLEVIVWDPTDDGFQPRGKQVNDPGGIFYTSTTGIWQTVWMEPVPESYISDFSINTNSDKSEVEINPKFENSNSNDSVQLTISTDEREIINRKFGYKDAINLIIPNPVLWSPDHPFLYDLKIQLIRNNKVLDEVKSYFGMRKISIQKDENGFNRLALNNEILFQNGPLDQGFWPDGIYTPPTDEAMRYDIEMTKKMGFNMLRKHVKVENRRFYYWCDKVGILVWQDMPSANGYVSPGSKDLNPTQEHKDQFELELTRMIQTHYNHPSIVMWVPFNEGWGQYDTKRIVDLIYSQDSSRLVDNATGWEDRNCGDVIDIHHYPEPRCPEPEVNRASVLGEFGGLGFYVEGHTWQKENWGYEKMQNLDELLVKYEDFYREIFRLRDKNGLAACVYTQTTDVETETNGLMTYDRDRVKMGTENILNAHLGIVPPRLESPFREFISDYSIELNPPDAEAVIYFTLDGKEPDSASSVYSGPVKVNATTNVKAMSRWPDGKQSRVISYELTKVEPQPATYVRVTPGLKVNYYEGNWEKLPDFDQLTPAKNGIVDKPDLAFANAEELFGLTFQGFIEAPKTGVYILYLSSDDGAKIYLDDHQLIDYDGIHGAGERKSSVALEQGLHSFRLIYFQRYGGRGLELDWQGPDIKKQEISDYYFKNN